MQDRLKYRVFDKRDNKFKNILGYTFSLNYPELIHIQWANGTYETCVCLKDLVFCQCTGLKDKNGKLIYEGDIVKFKYFDRTYKLGRIDFDKELGMFQLIHLSVEKWDYLDEFKLEIIGNIYESPELLEG